MADRRIARGDVWMADFGTGRGHEQRGMRPGLVISDDALNQGRSGLVVALPLTSRSRGRLSHVAVSPPEGGLSRPSHIKCEDVRSMSVERFGTFMGQVSASTMAEVEDRLRLLLDL